MAAGGFRQLLHEGAGVGERGHVNHEGVEIVVVVTFLGVVMRGAGGDVVLSAGS